MESELILESSDNASDKPDITPKTYAFSSMLHHFQQITKAVNEAQRQGLLEKQPVSALVKLPNTSWMPGLGIPTCFETHFTVLIKPID